MIVAGLLVTFGLVVGLVIGLVVGAASATARLHAEEREHQLQGHRRVQAWMDGKP